MTPSTPTPRAPGATSPHDTFGGGIGLSRAAYHRFDEIVDLGLLSTTTCPCDDGCPSCVMLSRRPDGNKGLSKAGAIALLEALS